MTLAATFIDGRLPELLIGLGLDAAVMFILAYVVYFRRTRKAEFFFAFVVVNLLVFAASYMMTTVSLDTGIGFGLFALFAVMRFRTDAMPIQEMTYLFASFVVAAVNALAIGSLTIAEVVVIDAAMALGIYFLGYVWLGRQHQIHSIVYERIENIVPARRGDLIADIAQRTGLDVVDVSISQVNFLNDTAVVTVTARRHPDGRYRHPGSLSLEETMVVWSMRRADLRDRS